MREVVLHDLLQHHHFVVLDLVLLLLLRPLASHMLAVILLLLLFLHADVIAIAVVQFYELYLLFRHGSDSVVEILVDFCVAVGDQLLASFDVFLYLFIPYNLSLYIALD